MKSLLKTVTTVGILVGLAGCASTPPLTVQTGPDAEITADGLVKVDNSVMGAAWVQPDLDLQPYTKMMIDDVVVAYKKDPEGRRRDSPGGAGGERNFALSSSQMDVLKNLFQEAVVKELTKDNGYQLVDTPAPDVLRISCYLMDLVVKVPTTEGAAGRSQTFARSYAEVTVVFELHDSESQEILARVADRGDPTVTGGYSEMAAVNPAFVRSDVTRMFEYWAGLLREGVDRIYEAPLP